MSDIRIPTIDELIRKRKESLAVSERAIIDHPKEYCQIKKIIRHVVSKPFDIEEYYTTAKQLTRLLSKMAESSSHSIFYYYYKAIDPQEKGQARYFRANCVDLAQQLHCVDHLRQSRRHIRIVQKHPTSKNPKA